MTTNIAVVLSPIIMGLSTFSKGNVHYENVVRTVALNALGEVKSRIHQQGKASDGGDIGKYSTAPMYVSVQENQNNKGKNFGRPIGKTGKSKFKSGEKAGQDHSSRFFPGGYNEYKTKVGLNVLGKVNLSFSGELDTQLTLVATARGYGLGWANDEMFLRAGHLEKKYSKKIWALTEEEAEAARTTAEILLKDAFS